MLQKIKKKISKTYMKNKLKNEKTFETDECSLKYLLMKKRKSEKLLVVFSGFPAENQQPAYNYVLKFKSIGCNKLFILDDFGNDSRGSYYLGKNKDFFIERSVFELIEKVRKSKGIDKENVITLGSSKGGFASLFFAFKYGYGTTISGAPQYALGDYLSLPIHTPIMKYITGGESEDDISFLNNCLAEKIEKNSTRPNVFIHVSKNEHHYENHVIPLTEKLKGLGYPYQLDLGNYLNHGDVGKHFPLYVKKVINAQ